MPPRVGGPVAQQHQHGQGFDGACHAFQQVQRHGIDELQVLQHQQQAAAVLGRFTGRRSQAGDEHGFEQALAVLGLQGAGEIGVGQVQVEHAVQQRQRVDVLGRVLVQGGLGRAHLAALRQARVDVEERPPHGLPGQVGRAQGVGLTGAAIADEAAAPRQADALGHQARLAHAGLGADGHDLTLAPPSGSQPLDSCWVAASRPIIGSA